MRHFGLIGFPLSHSFSEGYFKDKFVRENISNALYTNYPIANIEAFNALWDADENLEGLNVTIPYKEEVIAFLDEIDPDAKKIGAINVIDIRNNRLKGYNTDSVAFLQTLQHHCLCHNQLLRHAYLAKDGIQQTQGYAALHDTGVR